MNILSLIISIISLLASVVTLFAVWGNIANYYFNRKNFKTGGLKIIYNSGQYQIYKGYREKLLYQSSDRKEDFICYRGEGKEEKSERIKPFKEWTIARRFADIREPNYPIKLL